MIKSFRHSGLKYFFLTGSKAGIQPIHVKKLNLLLSMLDQADEPKDMSLPGWNLHELKGDKTGKWSVKVNGNWLNYFLL